MREHGIVGKHRRRGRRTTIPDPAAPARGDLIGRDFTVDPNAINTRWCGDITYIRTGPAGSTSRPSSTSPHGGSSAGHCRPPAHWPSGDALRRRAPGAGHRPE